MLRRLVGKYTLFSPNEEKAVIESIKKVLGFGRVEIECDGDGDYTDDCGEKEGLGGGDVRDDRLGAGAEIPRD